MMSTSTALPFPLPFETAAFFTGLEEPDATEEDALFFLDVLAEVDADGAVAEVELGKKENCEVMG